MAPPRRPHLELNMNNLSPTENRLTRLAQPLPHSALGLENAIGRAARVERAKLADGWAYVTVAGAQHGRILGRTASEAEKALRALVA